MTQVSPGQAFSEVELNYYIPALGTTHVGMVGTTTKGPVNIPTLVTSAQDFQDTFGKTHSDHLATYAARMYFSQGRLLTFVRVAEQNNAVDEDLDVRTALGDFTTPSTRASIVSSNVGPYKITAGTNDVLSIAPADGETSVSVTLTAGTHTTRQIVEQLNLDSDFSDIAVASVTSDNKIRLTSASTDLGNSNTLYISPDATSTANDTLGFTSGEQTGGDSDSSTIEFSFLATSPGTWGNELSVVVSSGTNTGTLKFSVSQDGNAVETFDNITTSNYAEIVNADRSTTQSRFIRVARNSVEFGEFYEGPDLTTADYAPGTDLPYLQRSLTVRLDDGVDGGDPSDANIVGAENGGPNSGGAWGLETFSDPESADINILCVPGISSEAVVSKIESICSTRGDCLGIIDPPRASSLSEVVDYHNGTGEPNIGKLTSSFTTIYWPWFRIYDPVANENVLVPPSAGANVVMTRTDQTDAEWYAPAGPIRGRIPQAIELEYNPTRADRDALYNTGGTGNAINPIINHPQSGITVWGQRTTQREPTALDRVNVRRLVLRVRKVTSTAAASLNFGPGDLATVDAFRNLIIPPLEDMRQRRGLSDFRVQADATLNPPDVLARHEVRCNIFIQPIGSVEFFLVNVVVTEQGASFDELIL